MALKVLRVCHENPESAEYNCGRCEKCLRTMITLEIAGVLGRAQTFREPLDLRRIARYPRIDPSTIPYIGEILAAAGDRPDIAAALRRALRRAAVARAITWVRGRLRLRTRLRRLLGRVAALGDPGP
ncbi:MAG TPA: hypothetical protein VM534_11160 [Thermoanaerobaculia bacterium]|nr:hypothetical protein [Thermoanaerobaculia bacterium]